MRGDNRARVRTSTQVSAITRSNERYAGTLNYKWERDNGTPVMIENHVHPKIRTAVAETVDNIWVQGLTPATQYDGAKLHTERLTRTDRNLLEERGLRVGAISHFTEKTSSFTVHLTVDE